MKSAKSEPEILLREVIVKTEGSEESFVRLMVSIPVELISRIRLPLFLTAPISTEETAEGERVREPAFISRVPEIEEPGARVRAESILVIPSPERALFRLPERFRIPEFVMVPPKLAAEEVSVPALLTLPEMEAELLKVPPVMVTLPVIPELLLNVPDELVTLAVIPELPLLLKVPPEFVRAVWVILPVLVKSAEEVRLPVPEMVPALEPEAMLKAELFVSVPEVTVNVDWVAFALRMVVPETRLRVPVPVITSAMVLEPVNLTTPLFLIPKLLLPRVLTLFRSNSPEVISAMKEAFLRSRLLRTTLASELLITKPE